MLYFITGNENKFDEVRSILEHDIECLDLDLVEIQDIDAHTIMKAKLQEAQKHHTGQFIVEDTSLYLDCLNGLPGPLIKWFMKAIGNSGLVSIAEKFGNKKAQAKTLIGYADEHGAIEFFEGIVEGEIVSPAGDDSFGWDPIFKPNGYDQTFGQMTKEQKNAISMRKLAAAQLKEYLNNK